MNEIIIKTTRELLSKLIESRFLGPAETTLALAEIFKAADFVINCKSPKKSYILKITKDICLKMIEKNKIINYQALAKFLLDEGTFLAKMATDLAFDCPWLMMESKIITLKMIETNRLSSEDLNDFFKEVLLAFKEKLHSKSFI